MSRAAWRAWRAGDIEVATRAATDDRLRFLTSYVRGRYEEALGIPVRRLDRLVVEARRHLARRADLKTTVTIPYADHPLTPYVPTIPATIDGRDVCVHVDTGGTFLVMGTERAERLGIPLTASGRAHHGTTRTDRYTGTVRELALGDARLTDVPVEALPTLRGAQDVIVVGTNVLEHFQPTIDHPGRRLVLAPRGTPTSGRGERVPFYLWDDHFMFVRGDRTWFVDTGFIHVADDRQAALFATPRERHALGDRPLRLGNLRLDEPVVATAPRRVPWADLGGVRIHGLLTNVLFGRYAWTIDFDAHEYVFQ